MPSAPSIEKPSSPATQRRKFAAAACILALVIALFGHVDIPSAKAGELGNASIVATGTGDHSHDDSDLIKHHCGYANHCSVSAILPADVTMISPLWVNGCFPVTQQSVVNTAAPPDAPPPKPFL